MQQPLYLYGAGGFAREVAWLADSQRGSAFDLKGFISDDASAGVGFKDHRPVSSLDAVLENDPGCLIAIAIARPDLRQVLADRLASLEVPSPVLIHDGVLVGSRVSIGAGGIICAGTTLTSDIQLGSHVHINLL